VKVEWEGVDERGRPWADSWLRMGKLSNDFRKELRQRLEAEESRGRHKGMPTQWWRGSARLQAVRARLEADSGSGSDRESGSDSESGTDCDSEPAEYAGDDERSLRELLQRDDEKREGKVRVRERAAARTREIWRRRRQRRRRGMRAESLGAPGEALCSERGEGSMAPGKRNRV